MKRFRSLSVAATFLCGLLFVFISPANAAGGVSLGNVAPAAGATGSVHSAAGGTGIHPLDIITCTGKIDNPHKSSHVPGTVNVEASVTCTAPVSALSMQTGLYRNGILVGSYSNGNTGSPVLAGAFATPCVKGTYIGAAAVNVIFPPGYLPPAGGFVVESPPVVIAC